MEALARRRAAHELSLSFRRLDTAGENVARVRRALGLVRVSQERGEIGERARVDSRD